MQYTLSTLCLFTVLARAAYIVPGAHWKDTNGNLVNAHAGGINYDEETKTFWLFGEYKVEGHTEGGGIRVYSSKNLAKWEDHGLALAPMEGHPRIDPSMVIQRPKVAYAESTGKYNMWWHADAPNRAYNWLLQGHAVADNYSGPYTYVDAYLPLGNWSQDFGMFTDPDTKRSYAMYSNGDSREGRDVYLTSYNEDVTHLDQVVYRWHKSDLEAPSIVKTDVGYFAIMSHKTGYRPNNVVAYHADTLGGPWSQPWIINPLNTRGLNSQSGNTLTIRGSKQTTHLYLGDRWDLNANWEATYVWLPLIVDCKKKSLNIEWIDVYDLNVETGEWTEVEGQTYYSADATLRGNAFHQEAPFASRGTIATGIDGNDSTITFAVDGQGGEQWVSFYYQNTDDMGFGDAPYGQPDRIGGIWILRRYGWVEVNNDPATRQKLSMKDTHKGIIMASPLALNLTLGRNNITLGGLSNGNGTKAADVDKIIVYPLENPL
ncbi:Arabinanase/levansucrase/invertase [Corynespora cassiicola Philippines]|uniref:Arabinanase/levansucrase/invertase n=1 Tax=Corynespora cassiicola Philippines TaxID=1448308 RepID=A0A2T2N915_CORCC|nr:Arabinanase/levansucrase/invertase [Corynespora cassiicola Philippines]